MIHVTGIDPDTHGLSFAYISYDTDRKKLTHLKVASLKISKSLTGRDAAMAMCQHPGMDEAIHRLGNYGVLCVEGQDSSYTGKTNFARPKDIMYLALVAGACIGQSKQENVYCPTPHAWKGTVPKHIHQCRTLNRAGIKYEIKGGKNPYPVPLQYERFCLESNINPGDWLDLNDALGLALWGLEKFLREKR